MRVLSVLAALAIVSGSQAGCESSALTIEEGTSSVCSFDGEIEREHAGYSGSGYINTANRSGAAIRYEAVSATTGSATLTIRFANGGSARSMDIRVGGSTQAQISLPNTGQWSNYVTSPDIQLSLAAGPNAIELRATNGQGLANVDAITLTGTGLSPGTCGAGGDGGAGGGAGGDGGAGGSGAAGGITGASCNSSGSVTVDETIRVNGTVFDGRCQTYNATSALGDGSQSEGQSPIFRVENGGTLRNVIVGRNGVDGIHTYGNATLENITWLDVGEDAMTVKSPGNVTVRAITGRDASDKFFQVNAATNLRIENCIVDNAGQFLRQNGGTSFTINVTVDRCLLSNIINNVFRSDSSSSSARITNSQLINTGELCRGTWGSCGSD